MMTLYKNDEFCIKNDGFCIKNGEFCITNDEFCIINAGIGSAIVKPCGIEGTYGRGGKHLNVGHDDKLVGTGHGSISRADVAAVMVEAVVQRTKDLRFDICVGDGAPTTDLAALLESTRRPWEEKASPQ